MGVGHAQIWGRAFLLFCFLALPAFPATTDPASKPIHVDTDTDTDTADTEEATGSELGAEGPDTTKLEDALTASDPNPDSSEKAADRHRLIRDLFKYSDELSTNRDAKPPPDLAKLEALADLLGTLDPRVIPDEVRAQLEMLTAAVDHIQMVHQSKSPGEGGAPRTPAADPWAELNNVLNPRTALAPPSSGDPWADLRNALQPLTALAPTLSALASPLSSIINLGNTLINALPTGNGSAPPSHVATPESPSSLWPDLWNTLGSAPIPAPASPPAIDDDPPPAPPTSLAARPANPSPELLPMPRPAPAEVADTPTTPRVPPQVISPEQQAPAISPIAHSPSPAVVTPGTPDRGPVSSVAKGPNPSPARATGPAKRSTSPVAVAHPDQGSGLPLAGTSPLAPGGMSVAPVQVSSAPASPFVPTVYAPPPLVAGTTSPKSALPLAIGTGTLLPSETEIEPTRRIEPYAALGDGTPPPPVISIGRKRVAPAQGGWASGNGSPGAWVAAPGNGGTPSVFDLTPLDEPKPRQMWVDPKYVTTSAPAFEPSPYAPEPAPQGAPAKWRPSVASFVGYGSPPSGNLDDSKPEPKPIAGDFAPGDARATVALAESPTGLRVGDSDPADATGRGIASLALAYRGNELADAKAPKETPAEAKTGATTATEDDELVSNEADGPLVAWSKKLRRALRSKKPGEKKKPSAATSPAIAAKMAPLATN